MVRSLAIHTASRWRTARHSFVSVLRAVTGHGTLSSRALNETRADQNRWIAELLESMFVESGRAVKFNEGSRVLEPTRQYVPPSIPAFRRARPGTTA